MAWIQVLDCKENGDDKTQRYTWLSYLQSATMHDAYQRKLVKEKEKANKPRSNGLIL